MTDGRWLARVADDNDCAISSPSRTWRSIAGRSGRTPERSGPSTVIDTTAQRLSPIDQRKQAEDLGLASLRPVMLVDFCEEPMARASRVDLLTWIES